MSHSVSAAPPAKTCPSRLAISAERTERSVPPVFGCALAPAVPAATAPAVPVAVPVVLSVLGVLVVGAAPTAPPVGAAVPGADCAALAAAGAEVLAGAAGFTPHAASTLAPRPVARSHSDARRLITGADGVAPVPCFVVWCWTSRYRLPGVEHPASCSTPVDHAHVSTSGAGLVSCRARCRCTRSLRGAWGRCHAPRCAAPAWDGTG